MPTPEPLHFPASSASTPPAASPRAILLKVAAGASMLLLIATAMIVFYYTPFGRELRNNDLFRAWVNAQPLAATAIFVSAYALLGALALPVWPLQLMAGYCFGLLMGVLWCHLGAVIGAALSVTAARLLLGDTILRRVEPYHARLRKISHRLGDNGLLVVTALRISHVMPFGLTNYLLGITRIRLFDIILGTILGGTFSKMIHVALGADPAMFANWDYLAALLLINLLLLSPLALRYLRPRLPLGAQPQPALQPKPIYKIRNSIDE